MATAKDVGESEGLNAIPIWFGPNDRPLFGWLHLPEKASAGVVLCRPIGLEALSAHRAYRCLAEQLAAKGVATLQFDYTGTGDSAGDPAELVGVGTWLSDIGTAIEFVRQTGVSRVGLIGLRLGATLAANVAADNDIEALVLWDPCATGRGFLREQRMLAAVIGAGARGDPASPESLEIPGLLLPRDLAEAIRVLRLDNSAGVLARRLLLLTRPDRPSDENLLKSLSFLNVECGKAANQGQFIDVEPGAAVLPEQVIVDMVSWLARALDGATVPTAACAQPKSWPIATVAPTTTGRSVIERTVRIGAASLFGIVTEPQDAEVAPMPAVVFLNGGVLPHSGPARLWVNMARSWAAQGVRVLRLDLGGLGDSPTRPGHRPDVVYPAEGIEDAIDAARFIAPEDPAGVVLVGLCSGAYHGSQGALELNSRRVWMVNPGWPLIPPEVTGSGAGDSRRQAVRPLNSLARRLLTADRIARLSAPNAPALATWVLKRLQLYMPAAGWWMLRKLRMYHVPDEALGTLARRGAELLVIFSESELSLFAKQSRRTIRILERSRSCRIEVIKSMDHSIFSLEGRSELLKLLTSQVLEKVVPDASPRDVKVWNEGSSTG